MLLIALHVSIRWWSILCLLDLSSFSITDFFLCANIYPTRCFVTYICQQFTCLEYHIHFANSRAMAPRLRKQLNQYFIDASLPSADKVFDIKQFEKYLHDHIKLEGKTNNLGELVKITLNKNRLVIDATNFTPLYTNPKQQKSGSSPKFSISKKALKYYTKKFLKKSNLRDHLRVVSEGKNGFVLKYYNVDQAE
eukprot:NODE_289_length_11662_cov_0.555133.p5 type:complete len:194 gc:universal NODE_289_length_11662_cov_0.555133:10624-11205(+)